MAKNKKGKNGEGKKGKSGLIVLLVFILIVAAAITLTAVNAFGLRDNVLVPLLRNVPVIGGLMPEAEGETGPDLNLIIDELNARIDELIAENESLHEDQVNIVEIVRRLEEENEFLREFYDIVDEIQESHLEFMRALAEEEPDAFIDFFATMNPDQAEQIFRELANARVRADEWDNYVGAWGAMSPVLVAQAIETMAHTHMNVIVSVLPDLPIPTRAAILNALETDTRAVVLRQLYP